MMRPFRIINQQQMTRLKVLRSEFRQNLSNMLIQHEQDPQPRNVSILDTIPPAAIVLPTRIHSILESIPEGSEDMEEEVFVGEEPLVPFLNTPKTLGVIGAPMSFGQSHAGTDIGPNMLRKAGLDKAIKNNGWRTSIDTDLQIVPPNHTQILYEEEYFKSTGALAYNCSMVGAFLQQLAERTEAIARNGEFVLNLGGDHSIGLGSLFGILKARPDTGIIWVDAHADLNTPLTSDSGNIHGMPLGMMMADDEFRTRVPGFSWMKNGPRLKPNKLVYIGLRDVDLAERRAIKSAGILAFTMFDIDLLGIGEVMKRAISHLGESCPIHMSYDIDACDPNFAPSTGTAVRGGLTYREAHFVAGMVARTNRLCSMDMVEINPSLKIEDEIAVKNTVELGLGIIETALGNKPL